MSIGAWLLVALFASMVFLAICKAIFPLAFQGLSLVWTGVLLLALIVIVFVSALKAELKFDGIYLDSLSALLLVGGTILQIIPLLSSSPAEDTAKDDASTPTPAGSDSCETQPDPQAAKAIPLVKDLSTRNALEAAGWATIFCAALGAAFKVFFF